MEKDKNIKVSIVTVETKPYLDQNPGTSGLRKKVKHFQMENYLENFVTSIFVSHDKSEYEGKTLIVGGDGRFYNDVAIKKILKISIAQGISKLIIPTSCVFSTPAVSILIRTTENCFGGIILSASHNPGGENEDFGIKFNSSNGAPAAEKITTKMFEATTKITDYITLKEDLEIENAIVEINGKQAEINLIDSCDDWISKMKEEFDFESIEKFLEGKFSVVFDAMHGASGPYALRLFEKYKVKTLNCNVLPDFGGKHPDPNLKYAEELVEIVLNNKEFDFGAACDGDADRNMILGKGIFVSPSDSLAVIAANYSRIKKFKKDGLIGVARSMPTSRAVDRVASALGINCYEVPTGWKFFGNLMDDSKINLCGEESFGTSSSHCREKDGLWAVLAWLSILADYNKTDKTSVEDIMHKHWKEYGRDYYCRYDYEDLNSEQTAKVIENLKDAKVFEYHDPVDHSISKNQGWIYDLNDGRVIFRKSGTSSSGATIRIYFEKYDKENIHMKVEDAVVGLVEFALKTSNINEITGRKGPCVIT